MSNVRLKATLAFLVLFTVACLCGSTNTGVQVGQNDPAQPNEPVQIQTYKIGDIIQVGSSTIVMNSAEISGNRVQANFTIENKGSEDMAISSLIQFSAKDSEGVKLEEEIFDCGSSSMGGTILPGDKLKGDICWTGATTSTVKIYYEANMFSSGAVVWQIP